MTYTVTALRLAVEFRQRGLTHLDADELANRLVAQGWVAVRVAEDAP